MELLPRCTVTCLIGLGVTMILASSITLPDLSSTIKFVSPISSPITKIDLGVLTVTSAIAGFPICTTEDSTSNSNNFAESIVMLRISSFVKAVEEVTPEQATINRKALTTFVKKFTREVPTRIGRLDKIFTNETIV